MEDVDAISTAKVLGGIGCCNEALPYYKKIIDPSQLSEILPGYLRCLVETRQRSEALSIVQNVRDSYGPHSQYTLWEIEWLIVGRDYSQASNVATEYTAKYPDSEEGKILRLEAAFRKDDQQGLRNQVDSLKLFNSINIRYWSVYMKALAVLREDQFLETELVRFLRKFWGEQEAIFEGVRILVSVLNGREIEQDETVSAGSAVELEDEFQGKRWICISSSKPVPALKEYSSGSDQAKAVLGKKIGDVLSLEDGMGATYTVKSILPESSYVFQQVFGQESDRPESFHMRVITGSSTEQTVEKLLSLVNNTPSNQDIIDSYKKGKIPLGGVVQQLRGDEFDIWNGFVGDVGLWVSTCSSQEQAIDQGIVAQKPEDIIIDIWGLFSWDMFSLKDISRSVFRKIFVAQSTLDRLRTVLFDLKQRGLK